MALLRRYIDQTTVASLASNANLAIAHNLGTTPHSVFVQHLNTGATSHNHIRIVRGAVSNTVYNAGNAASGDLMITSILFHSMIQ